MVNFITMFLAFLLAEAFMTLTKWVVKRFRLRTWRREFDPDGKKEVEYHRMFGEGPPPRPF